LAGQFGDVGEHDGKGGRDDETVFALTPGPRRRRVYDVTEEAIAAHAEHGPRVPSSRSIMLLYPIDGAVHRVHKNDTAFNYRDTNFVHLIAAVDPDPAATRRHAEWVRGYWEALHPRSAGGTYVNFMMEEGQERVQATYRENYERLSLVKRKYDPDNFFHVNQNIRPAR
jgi:FAD/FMN-containing dehydrogenase